MIVDYQTHWYPPASLDCIEGLRKGPRTDRIGDGYRYVDINGDTFMLGGRFFDLDTQIASMDDHGVDLMVCSPTLVGDVAALELSYAREMTDLLNREMSRAQAERPGRFVGLAMLPMQDVDAALESLDTAIGELGLAGVCMLSHIDGRPMADSRVLPVFERIHELGVPLFIHPANRSSIYRTEEPLSVERGVNWLIDTTKAALALIFSGILDRCPGLTVVHPHAGGVLPFVVNRMASAMQREPAATPTRPLLEYLQQHFYVDSCSETPGALRMAIETYGLDRVLLATDYPWQSRADRLAYVHGTTTANEADAIFFANTVPTLSLPASAERVRKSVGPSADSHRTSDGAT